MEIKCTANKERMGEAGWSFANLDQRDLPGKHVAIESLALSLEILVLWVWDET